MRHGNTKTPSSPYKRALTFRSYLWGMETLLGLRITWWRSDIPILPMRHGNSYITKIWFCSHSNIPILPMRHGNRILFASQVSSLQIPILPMRHGNLRLWALRLLPLKPFRSYLWGMETQKLVVGNENRKFIPILPMRHGNPLPQSLSYLGGSIPILPMRHGNLC